MNTPHYFASTVLLECGFRLFPLWLRGRRNDVDTDIVLFVSYEMLCDLIVQTLCCNILLWLECERRYFFILYYLLCDRLLVVSEDLVGVSFKKLGDDFRRLILRELS
jgi:hypothetical protein